jgi:hypothetical protein
VPNLLSWRECLAVAWCPICTVEAGGPKGCNLALGCLAVIWYPICKVEAFGPTLQMGHDTTAKQPRAKLHPFGPQASTLQMRHHTTAKQPRAKLHPEVPRHDKPFQPWAFGGVVFDIALDQTPSWSDVMESQQRRTCLHGEGVWPSHCVQFAKLMPEVPRRGDSF